MRWLILPLLVLGCAKSAEEDTLPFDDSDALVGAGGNGNGGGPAELGATRLLFFTAGEQAFLASAAGTEARPICGAAELRVDDAGERVLCIPADEEAPLSLYDVTAEEVVATYEGWRRGERGSPFLSADGGRVAFRSLTEDDLPVVRVMNDVGEELGSIRALEVLGFANPRTLLIEQARSYQSWVVGSEPIDVAGGKPRIAGPEPAGVVYEVVSPAFKVFFLEADTGRSREIGEQTIGGVHGHRVLLITREKQGLLVDLVDGSFSKPIGLPTPTFDKVLGTRLVGPNRVIAELQTFATCGLVQERYAITSSLVDAESGERRGIFTSDSTPHVAEVDAAGRRAVVVDVDACGNAQGTGRVVEIGGDNRLELADLLPEPVAAASLSPDGRFVAVAVADGVRVVDLAGEGGMPQTRSAATGGAGGHLTFR